MAVPQLTNRTRRQATFNVSTTVDEYELQQATTPLDNTMQKELNILEVYAETDKGREAAQWLNQNKAFLNVQHLQKFCHILRDKQGDHTFIQDFAAGQGLTYLCSISLVRQTECDILVMILDIFQTILNTRDVDDHELIGYHLIREHSHAIQAIVNMFECSDKTVKCKVIRLCTIMCMHDDVGFEAVKKAMYAYGERLNCSSIFDDFVRSMYFEQDLEFRRDALKFVNALLNLSPGLKRRIDSRHMLRELGFDSILDQLWDAIAAEMMEQKEDDTEDMHKQGIFKNKMHSMRQDESVGIKHPLLAEIREQLILYRQMKEEDDKKMLWQDVNLNDPEQIVRHLFKKAMQQKHTSEFMQTLISMCTIPDHASAIWRALPMLMLNATGQELKAMKLQMDGDHVKFEDEPHLDMKEEEESDDDPTAIFNDVELLKEKLNEAMQDVIGQEQQEINQQMKTLNKTAEKLTRKNMKLENQKIGFMAKSASQQFKIDEMCKQLEDTQTQLKEALVRWETRSSVNAAPIPGKIAPIHIPASVPLPCAPIPAPLPGINAAPIPMSAPLPGAPAPFPAPLPGAPAPAPVPSSAPIAAPIPSSAPIAGSGLPPPIFNPNLKKKSPVPAPRKKMVPFHWKPIKKITTTQNSIWSDIALDKVKIDIELNDQKQNKTEDNIEAKPSSSDDDAKERIHLNIDELETLFGKPNKKRKKKKKQTSKPANHKSKKPKRQTISLLDDKRSYNMCIALSRLKLANSIISDSILALNETHLNLDKIQKLITIVPTVEEQGMFNNFDGDAADLDTADKFCYALRNIDNLQERLKFWEFKLQFEELCSDEKQRINVYTTAHDTMLNSTSFQKTLQYILCVGNYMNHNTKKGGVVGFNVESLLALDNNKSADKSESLLSFIVKQIRKHNAFALDFAPEFVKVLPPAIKLDAELIKNAIAEIGKMLDKLQGKIKQNEEDKTMVMVDKEQEEIDDVMQDMFGTKMATFYKEARSVHNQLEEAFKDSQTKLLKFGEYLGQKEDVTFEYMQYMLGFAENVNKVVRAIEKKEMNERLRKKREETKKKKKEQRKLKEAKRKEDKMAATVTMKEKMENDFAEEMLKLLSRDNIHERRQSRWLDQGSGKDKETNKPTKHDELLVINELDDEPVFNRQTTEFVIKKPKNKHKKKRKKGKTKKSKLGKLYKYVK
eukprot:579437_1